MDVATSVVLVSIGVSLNQFYTSSLWRIAAGVATISLGDRPFLRLGLFGNCNTDGGHPTCWWQRTLKCLLDADLLALRKEHGGEKADKALKAWQAVEANIQFWLGIPLMMANGCVREIIIIFEGYHWPHSHLGTHQP